MIKCNYYFLSHHSLYMIVSWSFPSSRFSIFLECGYSNAIYGQKNIGKNENEGKKQNIVTFKKMAKSVRICFWLFTNLHLMKSLNAITHCHHLMLSARVSQFSVYTFCVWKSILITLYQLYFGRYKCSQNYYIICLKTYLTYLHL